MSDEPVQKPFSHRELGIGIFGFASGIWLMTAVDTAIYRHWLPATIELGIAGALALRVIWLIRTKGTC